MGMLAATAWGGGHLVAALGAHQSQVSERHKVEKLLRDWAGATTTRLGLPEGRLTEAFRRIDTA